MERPPLILCFTICFLVVLSYSFPLGGRELENEPLKSIWQPRSDRGYEANPNVSTTAPVKDRKNVQKDQPAVTSPTPREKVSLKQVFTTEARQNQDLTVLVDESGEPFIIPEADDVIKAKRLSSRPNNEESTSENQGENSTSTVNTVSPHKHTVTRDEGTAQLSTLPPLPDSGSVRYQEVQRKYRVSAPIASTSSLSRPVTGNIAQEISFSAEPKIQNQLSDDEPKVEPLSPTPPSQKWSSDQHLATSDERRTLPTHLRDPDTESVLDKFTNDVLESVTDQQGEGDDAASVRSPTVNRFAEVDYQKSSDGTDNEKPTESSQERLPVVKGSLKPDADRSKEEGYAKDIADKNFYDKGRTLDTLAVESNKGNIGHIKENFAELAPGSNSATVDDTSLDETSKLSKQLTTMLPQTKEDITSENLTTDDAKQNEDIHRKPEDDDPSITDDQRQLQMTDETGRNAESRYSGVPSKEPTSQTEEDSPATRTPEYEVFTAPDPGPYQPAQEWETRPEERREQDTGNFTAKP